MKSNPGFDSLRAEIVRCRKCPRLVDYRENVKAPPSLADQEWWRKPVPGFGDLGGSLLILGLAPARTGAERTGRIFTGDASSRFLVSALYEAGYANRPVSESRDDGLEYSGCYVTAVVKCVPPGDRPLPSEFHNCGAFLDAEVSLLPNLKGILALGSSAFKSYMDHMKRDGRGVRGLKFGHGASYRLPDGLTIYASYHPSPRNTNTGKLTKPMLVSVLKKIRKELG
ncbi:MAG: uracil-DNA glycosylase [Nitrososphaerota archaeon]|nr:uracil-DNA glycosylase [Nitrososphaerota archaeon]